MSETTEGIEEEGDGAGGREEAGRSGFLVLPRDAVALPTENEVAGPFDKERCIEGPEKSKCLPLLQTVPPSPPVVEAAVVVFAVTEAAEPAAGRDVVEERVVGVLLVELGEGRGGREAEQVTGGDDDGEREDARLGGILLSSRASPKSQILRSQFEFTSRFFGFRSRWIVPLP